MTRNIALYIRDILANMEHAENFVDGMSYDEFQQDLKTWYAVVRCLEIIGEASKNVPSAIRRKHPAIPFKEMAVKSGTFLTELNNSAWPLSRACAIERGPVRNNCLAHVGAGRFVK